MKKPQLWRHVMHPEVEAIILAYSAAVAYALMLLLHFMGFILVVSWHAYLWTFVPLYIAAWILARILSYIRRGW